MLFIYLHLVSGVCSPSPSPPVAHHSPVMERLCLKQESVSDNGQPLDFSVKPFGQGSVPSTGQFRSEDQPIDLSVKKLPNESSYSDHVRICNVLLWGQHSPVVLVSGACLRSIPISRPLDFLLLNMFLMPM